MLTAVIEEGICHRHAYEEQHSEQSVHRRIRDYMNQNQLSTTEAGGSETLRTTTVSHTLTAYGERRAPGTEMRREE